MPRFFRSTSGILRAPIIGRGQAVICLAACLVALWFLAPSHPVAAQWRADTIGDVGIEEMPPQVTRYDSARVTARHGNQNALRKMRQDEDLNYDRHVEPSPSLFERFVKWLSELLAGVNPSPVLVTVLTYVGYGLVAIALIYLIVKLVGGIGRPSVSNVPAVAVTDEDHVEDIATVDIDPLLAAALAQRNYRRAVRLQYLAQIKRLAERGLIHWRMDKTNYDYQRELAGGELRTPFAEISLLFEYVWYGDMALDEPTYRRMSERFAVFGTRLEAQA